MCKNPTELTAKAAVTILRSHFQSTMANSFRVSQFRSATPLSYGVFALLGLQIAAMVLTLLLSLGLMVSPDWSLDLDDGTSMPVFFMFVGMGELLRLVAFVLTVIVFLIWEHRAYSNLSPLRAEDLDSTPGWAVGWWFVPFANLVKPYQVMKEIWIESDPEYDEELGHLASTMSAPAIFGFWWALWILYNIGSRIVDRTFNTDSPDYAGLAIGEIAVNALGIVGALLLLLIVKDITERQNRRNERIQTSYQAVLPPPPASFEPAG